MELDHNGRLCTVDFRLARIKGGSAEAIDGQNTDLRHKEGLYSTL